MWNFITFYYTQTSLCIIIIITITIIMGICFDERQRKKSTEKVMCQCGWNWHSARLPVQNLQCQVLFLYFIKTNTWSAGGGPCVDNFFLFKKILFQNNISTLFQKQHFSFCVLALAWERVGNGVTERERVHNLLLSCLQTNERCQHDWHRGPQRSQHIAGGAATGRGDAEDAGHQPRWDWEADQRVSVTAREKLKPLDPWCLK